MSSRANETHRCILIRVPVAAGDVLSCRDLDSVGAVGAAAPTDFEESSFCTLDFHTKIPLAIVFGVYLKICTQSFEILTCSYIYQKYLVSSIQKEYLPRY